nr:uncharacterized protein LOC128672973 isoform X2 [Plodia interpunctella]
MLSAFLNDQDSDGSIFKYLFAIGNEKPSSVDFDNLDIATLDPESIKKIVQRAKQKYDKLTSRKLHYYPKLALDLMPYPKKEYSQRNSNREQRSALHKRKDYVIIAFDLMAQSIYSTRYRLIETKDYRRKYSRQLPYQIGVMIGSIMELKIKMAHIFATMYWMETRTHFIWYLILYEKMLTCHTDITYQIDRIFVLHKNFIINMRKLAAKNRDFTPQPLPKQTTT